MPTTAWAQAVAGQQASAAQYNNLLGMHPAALVYEGAAVNAGNTVAQATTQASNGNWVAQPFALTTGTEVNRVRLWAAWSGAGADVTVSLRADSAGSPAGTALVSILLPKEFLSASARWVELPLIKTGLTNAATYWIVTESGGDSTDKLLWGCSGSTSPYLKTSANGSSWASGTTQMLYTVSAGASGLLVASVEDSGSMWSELTYDANGVVQAVGEYIGGFRNKRTFNYTSGVLTGVS